MCEDLTPKQREVIAYMTQHLDASVPQIAEALGVHYNTIYKWKKTDKFRRELEKELHNLFRDAQQIALKRMIEIARNGADQNAIQAAKYILDNTDYKVSEKVEIGTTNDIVIKINND